MDETSIMMEQAILLLNLITIKIDDNTDLPWNDHMDKSLENLDTAINAIRESHRHYVLRGSLVGVENEAY